MEALEQRLSIVALIQNWLNVSLWRTQTNVFCHVLQILRSHGIARLKDSNHLIIYLLLLSDIIESY